MEQEETRDLLYRTDAIRPGHYLRSSGRHCNYYVQTAHAFESPKNAQMICTPLAERFAGENVQVVLSAAVGGLLPGYEIAKELGARLLYAEKRDGVLTLRRGFAFAPGTRVLIAEDMVSSGRSVRELIEIVRALDGVVAGICCIVDTSGGKVEFEYPYHPFFTIKVENYAEGECPLCKRGTPLDNV